MTAVSKKHRAADFLRERLADGRWHRARPLLDKLERRGLAADTTLVRARRIAGVEQRRVRGKLGGGTEWRLVPDGPAPRAAVCVLCDAPLDRPSLYCGPPCRIEAHRLARILLGDERREWPSLAARLAGAGRQQRGVTAIGRLLDAASLERRQGDGGES